MKSYINLFRNYANFSGFLKRKPYWTAVLIHLLILILPLVPGAMYLMGKSRLLLPALDLGNAGSPVSKIYVPWVLPFWCFYFLLTRIPLLSASVRRLHTLPRKGWWLLIGLIPVIGWFIVFIWLLQKGNYENFERRMKNLAPGLLKAAEKPRNGGWFFAVFALLAVCGFFLNRQVMRAGSPEAAFRTMQASLPSDWSSLKFWEKNGKPAVSDGKESTDVAEAGVTVVPTDIVPESTETPLPTAAPTDSPVMYLVPAEGKPLTVKKDGNELRSAGAGLYASAYAVTVGNYRSCVRDGACEISEEVRMIAYPGMIPEEGEAADSERDARDLPMVFVTRDMADTYCEWAGMRLPFAAEWKEAAKNSQITEYTAESANCIGTDRAGLLKSADQVSLTVPVTAFETSASDTGLVQMAGNVWEWTADSDENGLSALALGGAWNSYPANIGPGAELLTLDGYAAGNIGFRCFVDAENVTDENFEGGELTDELPSAAETIDADAVDVEAAEVEEAEVSVEEISVEEIPAEEPDETVTASDQETRAKDSAVMTLIPGGTFSMGAANGGIDERPVHEVTLSPYWIDLYEITNSQYALCVAENSCTEPRETKSFRQASYYGNPEFDNYPVIYVDWNQAAEYCEWAGGRLPTEAEWEYAAKGPDGYAFPWGNSFDSEKVNYSGSGTYDTAAVDATPQDISPFGVFNMGGNVTEWVFDRYQENWYSVTNQPADPTGPENGKYHVLRGGSAQYGETYSRTSDRNFAQGTSFNLDRGFRCARNAE